MDNLKDGGPAFPFECVTSRTGAPMDWTNYKGMTLRDYFAGQAMQALLQFGTYGVDEKDGAAEWAYRIADAMLKERDNG